MTLPLLFSISFNFSGRWSRIGKPVGWSVNIFSEVRIDARVPSAILAALANLATTMSQSIESSQTVRVWLGNREVERPIVRFETKERRLFGGCPETIKVPVPQLEAGEKAVRWRHRILIVLDNPQSNS